MTPSGRKNMTKIRITPRIRVQYSVYLPTNVRKETMIAVPKTGPKKVYHPPNRHMINISRERTQNNRSANTDLSNTTKSIPATPAKKVAMEIANS